MKRDLIVSLVLLAGIVSLYLTLAWIELPGARTFPRIILVIMGILSILLVFQSVTIRALRSKQAAFPFKRFLICFGLIIVYFFFMESLGFYLSAFLFFIAITFILGISDLTVRTALMRVAIGLVFTGILFILFNILLAVQTPKGLLI